MVSKFMPWGFLLFFFYVELIDEYAEFDIYLITCEIFGLIFFFC